MLPNNILTQNERLRRFKDSRFSPILGETQPPLPKDANEKYQSLSLQPINLEAKFLDFIRANKNLFETQDAISEIEIRVMIRGFLINGHWDSANFSREQIYSAKFFSKWISVDPKFIYAVLSRADSAIK